MFKIAITTLAIAIGLAVSVHSANNEAKVTVQGDQRCIVSNGIPDHSVGQFPNRGNPHAIEVQDITFCVDATPEKGTTAQVVRTVGIAENGVIIRPGTADWYDASSPRGHSRDNASGWNLDGIGASDLLGLDDNNAHVGPGGVYHYHGVPAAWLDTSEDTLLGWAADGFEIHYVGDSAQPS